MGWDIDVKKKCEQYGIEPVMIEDQLVLVCPKLPDEETQRKITEGIPNNIPFKFQEGPRVYTGMYLKMLFQSAGATSAESEIKGHDYLITVTGDTPPLTEEDSKVWQLASDLIKADPFFESWKIVVNGKVMAGYDKRIVKILSEQKKPDRTAGFSKDELLNLQITLENCQDVNDFINAI